MTKKKKSGRTQPRGWGEWHIGSYPNTGKPDHISQEQWEEMMRCDKRPSALSTMFIKSI